MELGALGVVLGLPGVALGELSPPPSPAPDEPDIDPVDGAGIPVVAGELPAGVVAPLFVPEPGAP